MQKFFGVIIDDFGNRRPGVSVKVLYPGSSSLAPVWTVNDSSQDQAGNPLTTDANGEYEYYTINGRYDRQAYGGGVSTRTMEDLVMFDPVDATRPNVNSMDGLDITGVASGDMLWFVGSAFDAASINGILGDKFTRANSVTAGWAHIRAAQESGSAPFALTQQKSGDILQVYVGSSNGGVGALHTRIFYDTGVIHIVASNGTGDIHVNSGGTGFLKTQKAQTFGPHTIGALTVNSTAVLPHVSSMGMVNVSSNMVARNVLVTNVTTLASMHVNSAAVFGHTAVFSGAVTVPTPANSSHAAHKGYVDAAVGGITGFSGLQAAFISQTSGSQSMSAGLVVANSSSVVGSFFTVNVSSGHIITTNSGTVAVEAGLTVFRGAINGGIGLGIYTSVDGVTFNPIHYSYVEQNITNGSEYGHAGTFAQFNVASGTYIAAHFTRPSWASGGHTIIHARLRAQRVDN